MHATPTADTRRSRPVPGAPRRAATDRRSIAPPLALLALLVPVASGAAAQPAATAPAAPERTEWVVGERTVPPPAGASDALRSAIAGAPAPDVAAARRRAPADEDQWRAMQRARPATGLDQLSAAAGVTIARDQIAGVPVYRVTPRDLDPAHAEHLFLHVHGGAYVFGGGDAAVGEAAQIAGAVGIPALSIDYRMPPDHPFPAAVDDVEKVYRHLLESRPARSIVLGGTSAGGGLALAAVHRFRSQGLAVPGAIYAGTPWADLTDTGDSLHTNEGLDRILVTYPGLLEAAALLYADGHDLRDPLISPVYGDFVGFPPTVLITGTRDMFLSDTARVHRALRAAGVAADLHVFEALSHAEYLIVDQAPEHHQFLGELEAFFARHLEP